MSILVKDGSGSPVTVKSTTDGSDEVPHHKVDFSALPVGASTESKQDAEITLLTSLDADTGLLATTVSGGKILVEMSSAPIPTGAATSAKQDLQTNLLTTMDADTGLLASTVIAGKLQVELDSAPLPTGASTAANQSTANTYLSNVSTSIDTLEATVSGGKVQVSLAALPALPAGTNNIGDVDVLTLPALSEGTNNIGKVEVTYAALPTGASTEATLSALSNKIPALISGNTPVVVNTALPVGTNSIGKVEVTSQTLPTGAATETTLAAIDTKLPDLVNSNIPVVVNAALPAGTNSIGKVEVTSQTLPTGASTEVTLSAIKVAAESVDPVAITFNSSTLNDGAIPLTPKFAAISAGTSGDNTLVIGVAGKKIRVLSFTFVAAGTVTVRFESGASGAALTGQMPCVANTSVTGPFSPLGLFETATAALLNLELSAAVAVAGFLSYVEV